MLHEALDFVKLGQVPPEPRPPTCLNPECNKKPLLVEFGNERELREFVITGLCASCQAQVRALFLQACSQMCEAQHTVPAAHMHHHRALKSSSSGTDLPSFAQLHSTHAQAYANAVAHAGPVSRPSGPTPPANQVCLLHTALLHIDCFCIALLTYPMLLQAAETAS